MYIKRQTLDSISYRDLDTFFRARYLPDFPRLGARRLTDWQTGDWSADWFVG